MPYKSLEDRRSYAREYQRKRRHRDEAYRIATNKRANAWDMSLEQRPHRLVRAAKHRARKLNLECNLNKAWTDKVWTSKCELTDLSFDISPGKRTMYSPSLDRRNNRKGYTQDNCRFILWGLNCFKSNGNDKDMFAISHALIDREIKSVKRI